MSPRGDGYSGKPAGPGLRGGRRLAARTVHIRLVIDRPESIRYGEAQIAIEAYYEAGLENGGSKLIADVGPAEIRQALISLSPELFAFLRQHMND